MKCLHCKKETSNPKYCSRSCAVTVHNSLIPKRIRKELGECLHCDAGLRYPQKKYCSTRCMGLHQTKQNVFGDSPTNLAVRRYVLEHWKYKCSDCGISEWNDKSIVLQLDHINGDCTDHRLENRRWLCPNCHTQTENWGVSNISPEGREKLRESGRQLARKYSRGCGVIG